MPDLPHNFLLIPLRHRILTVTRGTLSEGLKPLFEDVVKHIRVSTFECKQAGTRRASPPTFKQKRLTSCQIKTTI